jgi:hypothetical protein
MELETSTIMMIFFIIALIISIWKIYMFLPNKQLADDDTTKEAQEKLLTLTLKVIKNSSEDLDLNKLFEKIVNDESFNKEQYWRFNQNKLNQLLNSYYLKNPHAKCIADIHKDLR